MKSKWGVRAVLAPPDTTINHTFLRRIISILCLNYYWELKLLFNLVFSYEWKMIFFDINNYINNILLLDICFDSSTYIIEYVTSYTISLLTTTILVWDNITRNNVINLQNCRVVHIKRRNKFINLPFGWNLEVPCESRMFEVAH